MKKILVIDAQGGGVGKALVSEIKKQMPDAYITAVGTNSTATVSMLKGGADEGATGENAVVVCARKAEIIVGPIGIALADSMLGEVTAKMANAVCTSSAHRVLIPFNHCDSTIVGVSELGTAELIREAVKAMGNI